MSVGKSTMAPTTPEMTAGWKNYALEHSRSPEDILLDE